MAISVDYTVFPYLVTLPQSDLSLLSGTKYQLTVDVFWGLLSDYADSAESMTFPLMYLRIPATASTPSITEMDEDNYQLQFTDGLYSVNVINGNTNIRDVEVKNQVSVNTNNTTGFIDPTFLQYGTYDGGVTIDQSNSSGKALSGTAYPIGTPSTPSDNISDTRAILTTQGFASTYVKALLNLTSGDFSEGVTFIGQNPVTSMVIIDTAADVNLCEFKSLNISGVLDNGNVFQDCLLTGTVSSYDGFIRSSGLAGIIQLGGTSQTTINGCVTTAQTEAEIQVGSGSALIIADHKGDLMISGKTGTDVTKIGMASGKITITATCTTGLIELTGNGELVDLSGAGCTVVDKMLHGGKVANLQQLIELQRSSHAASGNIFYCDSINGNDANDGDHIDRARQTCQSIHDDLVIAGNHDVIVVLAEDASGTTTVDENVVITKHGLLMRGTGRNLEFATTSTTLPIIDIQADNVEISGFSLKTPAGHIGYAISILDAKNSLVSDTWIFEGGGKGLLIYGNSEDTVIRNTRIAHNVGDGATVDGTSEHTAFENCHISSNTGNGITITSTGHEISVTEGCVLHSNTNYNIDIDATSTGIHILQGVTIYGGGVGNVRDLASNTRNEAKILTEVHERLDLDPAKPNTYNKDASGFVNSDFTVTKTNETATTFDMQRS